jgi:hypothetical protein
MHVVLLCNGACRINPPPPKKNARTHAHTDMEISKTTVFNADGIRTMFTLSYVTLIYKF